MMVLLKVHAQIVQSQPLAIAAANIRMVLPYKLCMWLRLSFIAIATWMLIRFPPIPSTPLLPPVDHFLLPRLLTF